MNAAVRRRMVRTWGPCPRHAWAQAVVEIELRGGVPFTVTILYADLTGRAAATLPIRRLHQTSFGASSRRVTSASPATTACLPTPTRCSRKGRSARTIDTARARCSRRRGGSGDSGCAHPASPVEQECRADRTSSVVRFRSQRYCPLTSGAGNPAAGLPEVHDLARSGRISGGTRIVDRGAWVLRRMACTAGVGRLSLTGQSVVSPPGDRLAASVDFG